MQPSQAKWSLSNVTPLKAAIRGGRILTVKPSFCSEGNRGTDLLLTGKKGELRGGRRENWVHFESQINSSKQISKDRTGTAFTGHLLYTGVTGPFIQDIFLSFVSVLKGMCGYSYVLLNREANHLRLIHFKC